MKKELITGINPSFNYSFIIKEPAKGKKSFNITSSLLKNIYNKSKKIQKSPLLRIEIPYKENEILVFQGEIRLEKRS